MLPWKYGTSCKSPYFTGNLKLRNIFQKSLWMFCKWDIASHNEILMTHGYFWMLCSFFLLQNSDFDYFYNAALFLTVSLLSHNCSLINTHSTRSLLMWKTWWNHGKWGIGSKFREKSGKFVISHEAESNLENNKSIRK